MLPIIVFNFDYHTGKLQKIPLKNKSDIYFGELDDILKLE